MLSLRLILSCGLSAAHPWHPQYICQHPAWPRMGMWPDRGLVPRQARGRRRRLRCRSWSGSCSGTGASQPHTRSCLRPRASWQCRLLMISSILVRPASPQAPAEIALALHTRTSRSILAGWRAKGFLTEEHHFSACMSGAGMQAGRTVGRVAPGPCVLLRRCTA